jgi:hypothetical protein
VRHWSAPGNRHVEPNLHGVKDRRYPAQLVTARFDGRHIALEHLCMRLEPGLAAAFATVGITNVARPYPHKLDHLLEGPEPLAADHVARHPVFFGAYDWHSAVHMHWLLARVLRQFPGGVSADEIRGTLSARLTTAGLAAERASLSAPAARTFERPYGWAWLLELRAELGRLADVEPLAAGWIAAADPLARDLAARLAEFVTAARYPIRAGTHANTAFACLLALDYAGVCDDQILASAIWHAAARWYGGDRDAQPALEPSLTDFLSPILCEAALMAAVMPTEAFAAWFEGFLPDGIGPLAEPPVVGDRGDPQIAHLDGLCLSRAWCLRRIATALGRARTLAPDDSRLVELRAAAEANFEPALPHTVGGDYVGEHWLASFAALALGEVP